MGSYHYSHFTDFVSELLQFVLAPAQNLCFKDCAPMVVLLGGGRTFGRWDLVRCPLVIGGVPLNCIGDPSPFYLSLLPGS
jgi:hypothetical protein